VNGRGNAAPRPRRRLTAPLCAAADAGAVGFPDKVRGTGNLAAASSGGIDWSQPSPAEPETMKRATYEDVLNAPENKVAEILDGELFLSPRPAPRHAVASSEIGMAIGSPFQRGAVDLELGRLWGDTPAPSPPDVG
jgi:hypothetical protein